MQRKVSWGEVYRVKPIGSMSRETHRSVVRKSLIIHGAVVRSCQLPLGDQMELERGILFRGGNSYRRVVFMSYQHSLIETRYE